MVASRLWRANPLQLHSDLHSQQQHPRSSAESSLDRRLGIRKIELVEEPIRDPAGFSFYFRVNGVPIYARGLPLLQISIAFSIIAKCMVRRIWSMRAISPHTDKSL